MLPHADNRDFFRMDVECPARFRVEGSDDTAGAIVKNLSGGGLLLWLDREVEPGTQLSIVIAPGKSVTPPLALVVKVIRGYSLGEEEGNFAAACVIEEQLEQESP